MLSIATMKKKDIMTRILPSNARLIPEDAKKVFTGEIFEIYQWQQKMYDGSYQTFEMAKRNDTVQIIGIIGDTVVVLDEQQPDGTERFSSLPGGRIDASDRSELEAAKREMLEETGYSFKNWKLLNVRQPQRKIEWFIYTFVAWEPNNKTDQRLDHGENIIVKNLKWREFLSKAPSNTISENELHNYKDIDSFLNKA